MTQPVPTSIPADGSVKPLWVPTIATASAPTIDEVTDSAVIDMSCYLTDDGWQPATNEQVSTDNRLCSRQTFERIGRFTDTLDIVYIYQPQNPSAADNKVFNTLRHKETGFIVVRWGADYEDDLETGDYVDVIPAECGVQRKQAPEANGFLRVMQKIFIRDGQQRDVQIVASS